ncbi:MAG: hypothetical protein JL50_00210 [Peptococcaceae bacterium BICA1-7]|nr:MAG: hypothetical protein JL50_00210 [Peptococcaceae bacterium BICA1-7]HBV98193.1 hypothetical protein [Desulfotomaculum sp.]
MKNKKLSKVVATGILMAGLVASTGGLSLAADNSASGQDLSPNVRWVSGSPGTAAAGKVIISNKLNMAANQNVLKEALADLVTAGTITQAQSDEVLTYFENKTPEKPVFKVTPPAEGAIKMDGPKLVAKFVDPLKDLVDRGTITQDQAQAIRDKMDDIAGRQMQQQWQTSLDKLVGEGTITRDQAGQILEFLAAEKQRMQSMLEQVEDVSKEQGIQSFKENLGDIKDPVSRIVDQGIINQQQAGALRQAMPSLPTVARMQKPSPEQLQANLDVLAAKGTITQDQTGQILDFLAANDQKMKDILDQVKNSDLQENRQYIKQNLADFKDPVSQMVDQGIISQQQADAVREAVGFSGVVIKEGPLGGGVSGGQMFFYSATEPASDDSQN